MEANHRLYGHFGFTPVRWFEELVRPLVDLPAVQVADGVALRPWPADQDEVLRAVRNAAFADHWGSAPVDQASWHSLVRGHGARADLSVVAVEEATGEVVGLCLNQAYPEDDELTGRQEAWIENLATVRPVARPRRRLVHDRLVDAGLRRGGLLPRHDRRRHRQPHRRGAALPQLGVRA